MKNKLAICSCLIILLTISPFSHEIIANNTSNTVKSIPYDNIVHFNETPISVKDIDEVYQEKATFTKPSPVDQFIQTKEFSLIDEATRFVYEDRFNQFTIHASEKRQKVEDIVVTIGDTTLANISGIQFISAKEVSITEYYQGIPQTNESTRTTCDLDISKLRCALGASPIPINKATIFYFTLGNKGSIGAVGTICSIYVDNVYIGMLTFGTFPANYSDTFAISLTFGSSWRGGKKELKLDAQTSTTDSNPNNNIVKDQFTWQQNLDLAVYYISKSPLPNDPFIGTAPYIINFIVVNFGLDSTANNTYALIEIRNVIDKLLYSDKLYLPSIPPGQQTTVSFPVQINRSGDYMAYAIAGDDVNADLDPNDNKIWRSYKCVPDGCGIWHLSLILNNTDIWISVNDSRLNVDDVNFAGTQWNMITSKIQINAIGANLPQSTCNVIVAQLPDARGGQFQPFTKPGTHTYTGGLIEINEQNYDSLGNLVVEYDFLLKVLTHEIGHLVSLNHPHEVNKLCHDDSAMQYDFSIWTSVVTEHDRKAMRIKWGN